MAMTKKAAQAQLAVFLGKDLGHHLFEVFVGHPAQKVGNVVKVIIERLPGDVALLHDVRDGELFHVALDQQSLCSLGDQVFHVGRHSGSASLVSCFAKAKAA